MCQTEQYSCRESILPLLHKVWPHWISAYPVSSPSIWHSLPSPAHLTPVHSCTLSVIFVSAFRSCASSPQISNTHHALQAILWHLLCVQDISRFILYSLVGTMTARTQSMQNQHNNGKMCTNWVFSLLSIFKGNISYNFLPIFSNFKHPEERNKSVRYSLVVPSFWDRGSEVWGLCAVLLYHTCRKVSHMQQLWYGIRKRALGNRII